MALPTLWPRKMQSERPVQRNLLTGLTGGGVIDLVRPAARHDHDAGHIGQRVRWLAAGSQHGGVLAPQRRRQPLDDLLRAALDTQLVGMLCCMPVPAA